MWSFVVCMLFACVCLLLSMVNSQLPRPPQRPGRGGGVGGGGGGGDANCIYKCPPPIKSSSATHRQRPWLKPGHEFTSNGCGSQGFQLTVDSRIGPCCDIHDACYSICGVARDYCDRYFDRCMHIRCKEDAECMGSAKLITMGASLFGCGPFLDAQQSACDCLDDDGEEFDSRVADTLVFLNAKLEAAHRKKNEAADAGKGGKKGRGFYSDVELKQEQTKFKGKEDRLVHKMLRKYPKELIGKEPMIMDINKLQDEMLRNQKRPFSGHGKKRKKEL